MLLQPGITRRAQLADWINLLHVLAVPLCTLHDIAENVRGGGVWNSALLGLLGENPWSLRPGANPSYSTWAVKL